jgi:hypothetical protein
MNVQEQQAGSIEGRIWIIETLKHLPDAVEAEIEGLSDAVLRRRPAEDEWSIKEIVGHMRDYAEVWSKRLYQVWAQNDPVFVSFDGKEYVRERGYQDSALAGVIAEMRAHRLKTVDLLSHAVDWSRLGQQPGVGRRTLKQFAERLIDHDNEHLAQIRTLKAAP